MLILLQLRRLARDLAGYAPPALSSRYLASEETAERPSRPEDEPVSWWLTGKHDIRDGEDTTMALTRILGHAEELASLMTPKVTLYHYGLRGP